MSQMRLFGLYRTRTILLRFMLAAVLCFNVACAQQANARGSTAIVKKRLQYVVIPHPDDEFAAWSLIEKSSENYPVFIVLTRGERTHYCTPDGKTALQTHLGEYKPSPNPYVGQQTSNCERARINSWQRFLNDMAGVDPYLSYNPPYKGSFGRARAFKVWADDKSARISFDLGDGDLTPEKVTSAIQAVRSERSKLFPTLPEYGVIGSAYLNPSDSRCVFNDHPDHRAVAVALFRTDQGTPGPQWGRTCRHDPDVSQIARVDNDTYHHAMYVDARGFRHGFFQRAYGWLSDVWPRGEDTQTIWSLDQAFWARF
ncbi:MAG: hypothetical protein ACRDYA_16040 [Egibacteraceae bacterium]